MMTEWYYSKMGLQQGPVPEEELREKIRRGDVGETTLVWREGMKDWMPVGRVPEFREGGVAGEHAAAVPPLPEAGDGATADVPYASPVDVPYGSPAEVAGASPVVQPPPYAGEAGPGQVPSYLWQSLTALAVSCVLALFICVPIGLPFAVVAVVYAAKVDGLRAQGRLMEAAAASKNARVWMIISFVFTGLPMLALLGLLIFGIVSGM